MDKINKTFRFGGFAILFITILALLLGREGFAALIGISWPISILFAVVVGVAIFIAAIASIAVGKRENKFYLYSVLSGFYLVFVALDIFTENNIFPVPLWMFAVISILYSISVIRISKKISAKASVSD